MSRRRVRQPDELTMFGFDVRLSVRGASRGSSALRSGSQIADVEANAVVRSRVSRKRERRCPAALLASKVASISTARWAVEARAQYLTVNEDQVNGTILDGRLALTWRLNPYLALGLGYRTFDRVDSADEDTPGFVDLSIDGPLLFVRASM